MNDICAHCLHTFEQRCFCGCHRNSARPDSETHCDLCGANLQNGEHAKRQCPKFGSYPNDASFTARPDDEKGLTVKQRLQLFERAVHFDRYEQDENVTSADNLMTFVSREIETVQKKADLFDHLSRIYDLEQNVEISSFWDGGWTLKFGDYMNGYTTTEHGHTLESLIEALAKYPAQELGDTSEDGAGPEVDNTNASKGE